MKVLSIHTLLIVLVPVLCHAQGGSYQEKAKIHYEKGEYREALYCFNHVLRNDSSNAEFFKLRGNCYFELNLMDSAERDYLKVIRLSDKFPEAYYNLGNVSYENKKPDQAEIYIRKFLSFKPNDPEGLYQLSTLLKNRKNDSAFFYLESAYRLDSANQYFYNAMAWEFFEQNNFSRAFKMARISRVRYALTNDLLSLEAYAAFCSGNFEHALKTADTLVIKFPDDVSYQLLRIKSKILKNTPTGKYQQNGFTFRLTEYADNMTEVDAWTKDPAHPYHYPKLLDKFLKHADEMTLPEFLMVYYGYTTDKKYSPYGVGGSALIKAASNEPSAPEALAMYKSALEEDRFHLQGYESVASLAMHLGLKSDFEKALTQYIGLMESILASGDGKSGKSAYFVISPRHEYHIIDYLGLASTMQALRHEEGHSFDVLSVGGERGDKKEIYFNIDKPWHSLSASFQGSKSDSKKKEKKKKKGN